MPCVASFVKCFQGLAYQLVDDALDFTGTQASLGKPALSDLGQVSIFMFFVKCRMCAYVSHIIFIVAEAFRLE